MWTLWKIGDWTFFWARLEDIYEKISTEKLNKSACTWYMSVCRLICVEVVQHFVSQRFYVNNTVTMVILPPTLNTLFILCQRKENPWTTRAFRECNCPWSDRAILKLWYSIKFLLQHADVSPFLLQYNDVSLSWHSCDIVGRRTKESNNCVVALSYDILLYMVP